MKLDADEALHLWGLRQYGRLRTGFPRIKLGGTAGEDYGESVMRAVDRFFEADPLHRIRFRALAQWVYGDGEPAATFRFQQPGETRTHALIRNGWLEWFGQQTPDPQIVFGHFLVMFSEWWDRNGIEQYQIAPKVAEAPEPIRMEVLDSVEAAVRIGKSVGALNMMLERGRIQGFKVRGRWRIHESEIRSYLQSKRP
jgi:excisionase family DNA binding protein